MAVSRGVEPLLPGLLRVLAVAGISISFSTSAVFGVSVILYAVFRTSSLDLRSMFLVLLFLGFGFALAGVFLPRRPAVFLISFSATMIGGLFGLGFFNQMGLQQFYIMFICGPSLIAVPFFFVSLHRLLQLATPRHKRSA